MLIHQDSPESSPKQARQSLHVQHMQMSVWTWGKNCNYLLGHPSSDDWSIPERVELPVGQKAGKLCMASLSTLSHHMPSIRKVVMSKYHSCVLTGMLSVNTIYPSPLYAQGKNKTQRERCCPAISGDK